MAHVQHVDSGMRLVMVLTSHAAVERAGRGAGLGIEDFAAPYYGLRGAGIEVVLASPAGGMPPVVTPRDSPFDPSAAVRRWRADRAAQELLSDSLVLGQVFAEDFAGAFYASGPGAMIDLPDDPASQALIAALSSAGKPIGLVAEGVAALLHVRTPAGDPLVKGRSLTGITPAEQRSRPELQAAGLLRDALEGAGARFTSVDDGKGHVESDNGLITGQDVRSACLVARRMIVLLGR
jgi:putative intracellular protease/amidase